LSQRLTKKKSAVEAAESGGASHPYTTKKSKFVLSITAYAGSIDYVLNGDE
jgi:hypothetical protein